MFAKYLMIIFVSPLYLAIQEKWAAAAINLVFYLLALFTFWFFGIGVIFWFFCVIQGFFELRKELMREQAELIAKAMASELRESSPAASI